MSRRILLFTVLLSLFATLVLPQGTSYLTQASSLETFPDAKAVDAQMTALMSRFLIPGAGLALIKNGQVVYTKGYGTSNFDKKQSVTDESQFGIGSITKSFTALAVMQLVEAGKIDLDAPVTHYLPEFKLGEDSYTPLLHVRHLLNQTSGLPRADLQWALSVPASRAQVIADVAKIKPTAKPGEVWQYCNQNYAILGAIIEKVSGVSYEDYLKKNVFAPLGMNSANLTIEELFKSENPALPYNLDVLNGFKPIPSNATAYQSVKMLSAAGAINANVKDMATYALMQLGKGKRLVSAESLALMHQHQVKITGMPEGDAVAGFLLTSDVGYGFGWMPESYRGKALVGHGGAIDGYELQLTLVPDEGVGVVILTNVGGASFAFNETVRLSMIELLLGLSPTKDIAEQMIKRMGLDLDGYQKNVALAKAYHPEATELDKYAGDYAGVGGKFNIAAKGKLLTFKLDGTETINELVPFAPGKFLLNGTLDTVIEFRSDANGFVAYQGDLEIARRSDAKVSTNTYADPKGRFDLPVAPELTLEQKGDLGVFKPKDGTYTITIGTLPLETDQDTTVNGLADRQTPSITEKPVDARKIPVGTLTWTQYVFVNADQSLFVVEALTQDKTVYFITVAGTDTAIAKATPALNGMLLGFKLK